MPRADLPLGSSWVALFLLLASQRTSQLAFFPKAFCTFKSRLLPTARPKQWSSEGTTGSEALCRATLSSCSRLLSLLATHPPVPAKLPALGALKHFQLNALWVESGAAWQAMHRFPLPPWTGWWRATFLQLSLPNYAGLFWSTHQMPGKSPKQPWQGPQRVIARADSWTGG